MNRIYIPSEEERIKIYQKIKSNDQNNPNKANVFDCNQQTQTEQDRKSIKKNNTKITEQEVRNLINRLTKDTHRDYVIKQQVENIKKSNLQSKKIMKGAEKIEERLLKAGKQLEQKKLKKLEEQQQRQLAKLQPTPCISERAKSKIDKPFLQRIDMVVDQKQNLMKKLANKYQPSFKPQLNPYSLFMAQIHNSKNFYERLKENEQKKKQIENQKNKENKDRQLQGATFNPIINQKSRTLGMKKYDTLSHHTKSQQKIKNKKNQNQPSFKPQINKRSQSLFLSSDQSKSICFQRLYEDNHKKSLQANARKKKMLLQNSYKPRINANSLKILEKRRQNYQKYHENQQYQEVYFDHQRLFCQSQSNFSEKIKESCIREQSQWMPKQFHQKRSNLDQSNSEENQQTFRQQSF